MSTISSNGDPVMAVPVTLELQYISSNGITIPKHKDKASYFIAATQADLNIYACNLSIPFLTPKAEYSNGPYSINVIMDG